jgi:hypothetical protein
MASTIRPWECPRTLECRERRIRPQGRVPGLLVGFSFMKQSAGIAESDGMMNLRDGKRNGNG